MADKIMESYNDRETDGILDLLVSSPSLLIESDLDDTLTYTILERIADDKRKNGIMASVINSMIGSCYYLMSDENSIQAEHHRTRLADQVDRLTLAFENLEKTHGISPDLVTYSLAYTALGCHSSFHGSADIMLKMAAKIAKKLSGGKRRKALAASRRKRSSSFTDSESSLKNLLGKDFKVLLETDDLAVVNKPSGVPCYHRKTTTAGKVNKKKKDNGGNESQLTGDISLEDALLNCNVPLSTLNPDGLGIVHRLDRGSSGCLVLAKNDEAHARLVSEFFLRRAHKSYLTVLHETTASKLEKDDGVIDSLVHGRPAKSQYRVLKRLPDVSLVEFQIFTGRKHQVRVHAVSSEGLASPVLNDELYGSQDGQGRTSTPKDGSSKRFFLHASTLAIPTFDIDVEAPLPSWWHDTMPEII
jgi:23S rRNA-/tRNA-specific pseudouridylate synthase